MRRFYAILACTVLLFTLLPSSAFAVDFSGNTVDLYWWNEDLSVKSSFAGSSVLLDQPMNPFQGQITVTLADPVEAGDYIDLELAFAATPGVYSIRSIELYSTDGLYFDSFDYSGAELDSEHLLLTGLGVEEKFTYAFNVVYINFSVSAPEYEIQTNVINGSPTKQYGYFMAVAGFKVTPVGELGFFQRILQGILNLPNALVEGIKKLFIPSESKVLEFKDGVDELLQRLLGPAYEATDIVDDFAEAMSSGAGQTRGPATLDFPELTVNLAGSDFTFGGWVVPLYPVEFQPVVDTLKTVVNMVCTLAFVNALKNRLEGFLH